MQQNVGDLNSDDFGNHPESEPSASNVCRDSPIEWVPPVLPPNGDNVVDLTDERPSGRVCHEYVCFQCYAMTMVFRIVVQHGVVWCKFDTITLFVTLLFLASIRSSFRENCLSMSPFNFELVDIFAIWLPFHSHQGSTHGKLALEVSCISIILNVLLFGHFIIV